MPHKFNKEKKMAGQEWLSAFMKRHPEIAVRLPEGTSMNRAKGFNKKAINKFFDNLEPYLSIDPTRIFNVDETGMSTVTKPSKILARKGKKRVGTIISAERGTNTTVICCMSATGIFTPPMFIFKRIRMAPHLMNDAPVGSTGFGSESGWVNEELFFKWLIHFQKATSCSPENPVVLISDNHSSHISLAIWQFIRDNGINFVTIPPHTSHRTQPLDVTFFKPLKTNYGEAVRQWLLQNPGKVVTPSVFAGLFNKAYLSTYRMELAISGFSATGIWPFNRNIFPEEEFIAVDEDEQQNERGVASTDPITSHHDPKPGPDQANWDRLPSSSDVANLIPPTSTVADSLSAISGVADPMPSTSSVADISPSTSTVADISPSTSTVADI